MNSKDIIIPEHWKTKILLSPRREGTFWRSGRIGYIKDASFS